MRRYGKNAKKAKVYYSQETFAKYLSEHVNYLDPQLVHQVYLGICRMILKELKENERVVLPDIGTLVLIRAPSRKIKRNGKVTSEMRRMGVTHVDLGVAVVPERLVVKFRPCLKMAYYFRHMLDADKKGY